MLGLMQNQQLLISSLIEFAERHHGEGEIVSRRVEGDIHRYTYKEVAVRSRQVANALDALKLQFSDRVATLAWNGYRHLELYFGVSGSGRVLHTLNPRLHPDQIAWITEHAEDQVLCFDMSFLPIVKAIHGKCSTIKHYIALCDADKLPADTGIPGLVSYEAWIGGQPAKYAWPQFDENSASSMCYTSGTTGNPKAALYSHRSTMLHAFAGALPDALCLSARDSILPVVPMFHVNAWGLPYAAAMTGAKLVFPGPAMDGKSIFELIESEKVSFAAGVPTVWQMMLGHMQAGGLRFSTLIFGQIMIAKGDVNLGPDDLPRSILCRLSPRLERPDVAPRLRLGQIHRRGPLAADDFRQIIDLLLRRPMRLQRLDRSHAEHRTQRKAKVCRVEVLHQRRR